jgi:hypothetical protein
VAAPASFTNPSVDSARVDPPCPPASSHLANPNRYASLGRARMDGLVNMAAAPQQQPPHLGEELRSTGGLRSGGVRFCSPSNARCRRLARCASGCFACLEASGAGRRCTVSGSARCLRHGGGRGCGRVAAVDRKRAGYELRPCRAMGHAVAFRSVGIRGRRRQRRRHAAMGR